MPLLRSIELESLLESVNTSAGINELLLTGEERVALGANFYLDILLCGTGLDDVSAVAGNGSLLILGMDTFLHFSSSFRNILSVLIEAHQSNVRTVVLCSTQPYYFNIWCGNCQESFGSFYIIFTSFFCYPGDNV